MDGAYSGKALAALIADAKALEGKVVLFWHTYNGQGFSGAADYRRLPKSFHRYFKEDGLEKAQ